MAETNIQIKEEKRQRVGISESHPILWKVARTIMIYMISLCIVFGTVALGVKVTYDHYFKPVDKSDKTPVKVIIPKGVSVSSIAKILKDNDIIRNTGIFKIIVDFSDQGSKLKAGEYALRKDMTMSQVIETITQGIGKASVKKFTITEGKNIEEIADSLVKQGILKDSKRFLELAKSSDGFEDYDFIAADLDNEQSKDKKYILEGYLFPDTYQVYSDANEEDVIKKMLDQFGVVFTGDYQARAEELGMTVDQVVTLASMIEKEGKPADFKKISAVFHNRLKKKMNLGSDVTVQYILKTNRLNLNQKDISIDSPYNTYKYPGLPVGPISNPGRKAIEAALYPDEQFMKEGYYFFIVSDPATGKLVFSKTQREHDKAVAKYRPVWQEYDAKQKQ